MWESVDKNIKKNKYRDFFLQVFTKFFLHRGFLHRGFFTQGFFTQGFFTHAMWVILLFSIYTYRTHWKGLPPQPISVQTF